MSAIDQGNNGGQSSISTPGIGLNSVARNQPNNILQQDKSADQTKKQNTNNPLPNYRANGKIIMIPPKDIMPNPNQPRRVFNEEKLQELAQSISENGMIHPITVMFKDNKPVLVAGERRLRAAKIVGSKEIACIAVRADDSDAALLTLVENIQREDMNCFEEAEGIYSLIDIHGLTQEDAAKKLGCAQSTVANRLRLLRLTREERNEIISSGLTERHARALLRLDDVDLRKAALARIVREKLTVVQSEKMIADWLKGNIKRKPTLPIIRDVRLFVNTINKAISTMQRSGIMAEAKKTETEEYIEYRVIIPKMAAGKQEGKATAVERPARIKKGKSGSFNENLIDNAIKAEESA